MAFEERNAAYDISLFEAAEQIEKNRKSRFTGEKRIMC